MYEMKILKELLEFSHKCKIDKEFRAEVEKINSIVDENDPLIKDQISFFDLEEL